MHRHEDRGSDGTTTVGLLASLCINAIIALAAGRIPFWEPGAQLLRMETRSNREKAQYDWNRLEATCFISLQYLQSS